MSLRGAEGALQGIEEGGRRVECCSVEGEIDKRLGQRLATRRRVTSPAVPPSS